MDTMNVVVFGSINMDLVARTPRLPKPGETLTGQLFSTVPGGKGANQAVACARLGIPTQMVGRVGGDVFGRALLENLAANGVGTKYITQDHLAASGVALIAVDESGENTIIVIPGANGQVDQADLTLLEKALAGAGILLMQLEIPLAMVAAAAEMAHHMGVTVILDPAPARPLPPALYPWVDILTPNQTEAEILLGYPVDTPVRVQNAAQAFLERGCRQVVIKMGSQGAYAANAAGGRFYPAFQVDVIDTVAAGDAFNAGMAAALYEGKPFEGAIVWGCGAGALAVTQTGAQDAMPDRAALFEILNQLEH